jgi:AcrR family transcriptional regulator
MAAERAPRTKARSPLNRERVLRAAIRLADKSGIESLSMRKLGGEVGVEAMSLYNHVAGKEDILDGMIELIVGEINEAVGATDGPPDDWKAGMRQDILAARRVLLRHRWAPDVLESRNNFSPAVMKYFDSLIERFRAAGFSMDLTHHALHALGSRALGFTQELYDDSEQPDADTVAMLQQMSTRFPNIVAMVAEVSHDTDTTLGWCDDQFEFEFALDLLLDGLDRLRAAR